MAILTAIEDLFKSFYELIATVVSTFYHIIQTFVNAVLSFFTGIINMIADVFSGAVDIVGGVGKFVLGKVSACRTPSAAHQQHVLTLIGNIVIIGLIAAGGYAYLRYTAQGRQVAAGKKNA